MIFLKKRKILGPNLILNYNENTLLKVEEVQVTDPMFSFHSIIYLKNCIPTSKSNYWVFNFHITSLHMAATKRSNLFEMVQKPQSVNIACILMKRMLAI